jgi:hypothetical protein
MAVAVEMHNTSHPEMQRDTVTIIERVLSIGSVTGNISVMGSQDSDR